MKQNILLFSFFLGILYLSLSSNKTGPAHSGTRDKTGRLGSDSTCANTCHKDYSTGPIGTTTCTIALRRKDWGASSAPVTGYIAGKTYIVTISGSNTISLPKYGFQLTATIGSATVGTFSNFPANVGQATASGVTLVEHTTPLSGTSGNYATSFEWAAPSSASGAITFWGIINAVDGNNAYNNDAPSPGASVILQDVTSVETVYSESKVNVYPNPFTAKLNVKIGKAIPGSYTINAYDLHGRKLASSQANGSIANNEISFNTSEWPGGIYLIQTVKDGIQTTVQVMK